MQSANNVADARRRLGKSARMESGVLYEDDNGSGDTYDVTNDNFLEEDHQRKKGRYRYCDYCAHFVVTASEVTYVFNGVRNIHNLTPALPSLNSRGRWEILNYRTSPSRAVSLIVPYRELVSGKCRCSRCEIDLEGNYDCSFGDWRGTEVPKGKIVNSSVPTYKRIARARPDFAVIPEGELIDILKWPELAEIASPAEFPMTERGIAILKSLKRIYEDRLGGGTDEEETELNLGKSAGRSRDLAAVDEDEVSKEREWVVLFTSKDVRNSCAAARHYFVRKLIKQNVSIIEIEVAISEQHREGRPPTCVCKPTRTTTRHNRHDHMRQDKGQNKRLSNRVKDSLVSL